jgi:hypothetical protein
VTSAVSASSSINPNIPSVMLQALKEEPPLNTKCKDKFLIQSTVITPEKETMTLHDIVCILSPLLQIETL